MSEERKKQLAGELQIRVNAESFGGFFRKKLREHAEKQYRDRPVLAVLGSHFYHGLRTEARGYCVDVRPANWNGLAPNWVIQLTRHKNFESSFMFLDILIVPTYSNEDSICFV